MANSIIDAVSPLVKETKKKEQNGTERILGGVLKKYRCLSHLSKCVGITRKKLTRLNERTVSHTMKDRFQATVTKFLEREDYSTTLPGKRDTTSEQKEAKQIMIPSDYMHNLHEKFMIENPTVKFSRSSFCKQADTHSSCMLLLKENMSVCDTSEHGFEVKGYSKSWSIMLTKPRCVYQAI